MADYFDSRWAPKELWNLDLPVETMLISDVEWHLDYPFWPTKPPEQIFDFKPRDVLTKRADFPEHFNRVLAADTRFPVEVGVFGWTVVILDGIHRLAKLALDGSPELQVRFVPDEYIARVD